MQTQPALTSRIYGGAYHTIRDLASNFGSEPSRFAAELRSRKLPHLSFSRISSIKSCPRRYFLEYVEGVVFDPPPQYFLKVSLFHKAVADFYRALGANRSPDRMALRACLQEIRDPEARGHIENALVVIAENAWKGWRVVSIEKPFVVLLSEDLPPCVGVIDLLLTDGTAYLVIDHKTGRNFYQTDFYDPSKLQMAIYHRYVTSAYPRARTRFFYDKYRWVPNLQTIRKPAISREECIISAQDATRASEEIRLAHKLMKDYESKNYYPRNGTCYACPHKGRTC